MSRCISPVYVKATKMFVACGKCNFCLQSKRNDWTFRLGQELLVSDSACFLTLTYSDSDVPRSKSGCAELDKSDLQLFFKRLRKMKDDYEKKYFVEGSKGIRYYAVGEYGGETFRPHYHAIMFNLQPSLYERVPKVWGHGHTVIGSVTPASIHYVTKYVIDRDIIAEDKTAPFAIMSRRPGLGANYVESHLDYHRNGMRNYTNVNGIKGRIPRYLKEKLFTSKERSKFAVELEMDMINEYREEVKRMSHYHPNPEQYYEQVVRQAYENVKLKYAVRKVNAI